ncbi:MAG TPA: protein kinase [Bryobacteraceae bacterium]|nr:protein kinase [Bryobacteraceae bacterium]
MSVSVGDRLGPYEILAPLGAGGMGEVYRARDTKLKREVALKVLPDLFASDPERMARFQREAEVLASLNHPHIAAIYGLEGNALVMELVEGENLGGPLPVETVLTYARQIAEALEYAHERGIIHRDLKPANVKITPEGAVKVLDFGLAKAIEDPGPASDPASSPTLTLGATRVGVILGTAAYMSPEQASGKTADRGSDIWSFGAVLHEMLAGKRAFVGESVSDTLATVLKLEPEWDALPAGTPASVRKLVRRCLTKDRKQRLQAIGEARIALENPRGDEPAAPVTGGTGHRFLWPVCLAAAVFAVALAALAFIHFREAPPPDRPLVRLDVDLGADVSLPAATTGGSSVVISPDGTRLVYASGSPAKLFTRRLDQPKATELPGTEGAVAPFFSPDGQWVGFYARNSLNKISVDGGAVVPLEPTPQFSGASWGEDGSILASDPLGRGLLRIPAGGGQSETVLEPTNGELVAHPQILPGGKAVLFTAVPAGSRDVDRYTIEVLTLADRHRKTVARGGTSARYLATSNGAGHLIYTNKATLFAVPFDPNKLEAHGTAVPILDEVAYHAQSGTGQMNVSRTGILVYRRGGGSASGTETVQWVDPAGKREPLWAKPGVYSNLPRLSPDGKRLALLVNDVGGVDEWVYDLQRDTTTRLTFSGTASTTPTWSPDGQSVVFGRNGKGLLWTRADGASQPQALTQSKNTQVPFSFTPDGKRLAYFEIAETGQIWTVPLEEQGGQWKAGKPEQFLKSQSFDQFPMFSPDGRWLAYASNEQGRYDVYVRAFPPPSSGQGGQWQISNSGGTLPHWSRTRNELLYSSGDQIMAVSYAVKGDSFVAEKPRVWIAKLGGGAWDLAPGGERVAVLTPVDTPEASKQEHEVVFLFNFFDYLRQRVPAGK